MFFLECHIGFVCGGAGLLAANEAASVELGERTICIHEAPPILASVSSRFQWDFDDVKKKKDRHHP
jgi:hypothetical protein